jgi:two-component system, cell cycle response regulator DivK
MALILLVEDNEMNREMLSRRLLRKGFEVILAENGLIALEKAEAFRPDLILMDLSLPDMDGWEATRRIKAIQTIRHIPVIAVTAHSMAGDREQALAAGCDDFATKPIDFPELLNLISKYLTEFF